MYSQKPQGKIVEIHKPSTPIQRANHFQRKNSNKSHRTSPSRSDSASLSKFFVKDIKSRINDPQATHKTIFDKIQVQKCAFLSRNDYFTQQNTFKLSVAGIPRTPLPKNMEKKHSLQQYKKQSNLLVEQENNNYKQLYQKQSKQFKQSARQILTLKLKNKNLQQNNNKLVELNQNLQKKIEKLQGQMSAFLSFRSSSSTEQNEQQQNHADPISRLKNSKFITVSKNYKNERQSIEKISKLQIQITNLRSLNQKLQNKQCQQCNKTKVIQQQLQRVQKEVFEAKQQIKRLNLQIDCIRRKSYTDLQNQRVSKALQYTSLKKRFLELLNEYTQLKKATKKEEISNKVKSAAQQKKRLKFSGSNIQELNSILQISVSSQQF